MLSKQGLSNKKMGGGIFLFCRHFLNSQSEIRRQSLFVKVSLEEKQTTRHILSIKSLFAAAYIL